MRCPGQDMRYWKGDVAFEVACPKCAAVVEFFKDESSRRCRRCGHLFPNPKASFDCAQWCEYAEKCLGVSPQMRSGVAAPEAAFASRLLTMAEDLFARNEAPATPALLVFQHARELVSKEQCNPRVVLAATLVIELEARSFEAAAGEPQPGHRPWAEELLNRSGMEGMDIRGVHGVLQRFRSEPAPVDIETQLVSDATALAQMALEYSRGELDEAESRLDRLKTQAGKERSRTLYNG